MNTALLLALIDQTRDWEYREGGREEGAMDCVHWVRYILAGVGCDFPDYDYPLGRAGAVYFYETYPRHFDPVEPDRIQPGDLVFLDYEGSPHLGLYAGGMRLAHCTRANGVIFQRMDIPPLSRARLKFYRVKQHGHS